MLINGKIVYDDSGFLNSLASHEYVYEKVSGLNKRLSAEIKKVREEVEHVAVGTSPYLVNVFTVSGNLIIDDDITETLYAEVWHGADIITNEIPFNKYSWERKSSDAAADVLWNAAHKGVGNTIKITNADVIRRSQFICVVIIGEETVSNV